jgi:signal transduction histidine kinase
MAVIVSVGLVMMLRAIDRAHQNQLGSAVATQQELQVAVRELSLLYEASSLLSEHQDLTMLINAVLERVVRILEPVQRGMIGLDLNGNGTFSHIATYGYENGSTSYQDLEGSGPNGDTGCWQDHLGRCICDDVEVILDGMDTTVSDVGIHRVTIGLQNPQRTIGMMLLETDVNGPFISPLETPTIVTLARQLGVAIENVSLVLSLREREIQRGELLHRATKAQEAERTRIARELHDETGQSLTALALGLQGIAKLVHRKPEMVEAQVTSLKEIANQALGELRHLISDLRPSHLDDLGLVPTLRWYVEQVEGRSDLKVQAEIVGEVRRLQPEIETTLFRIMQEALNHVLKHAEANTVNLALCFEPNRIILSVQDDGRGFSPTQAMQAGVHQPWGLLGIRERATLAGGSLTIDSQLGEGTRLEVHIPINSGESKKEAT